MDIIPVIDLMNCHVVHAVAGDRQNYRPISSSICESSSPRAIANTFFSMGFRAVYVADLNGICKGAPDWKSCDAIAETGLLVWLDSGADDVDSASRIIESTSVARLIIGLESVTHEDEIPKILSALGTERVAVSLDLRNGKVASNCNRWNKMAPIEVSKSLIDCGAKHMIVLDLAQVGTNRGTGTKTLCQEIAGFAPEIHLTAGGGVRGHEDLIALKQVGCDSVLVSTAIHNGQMCCTSV